MITNHTIRVRVYSTLFLIYWQVSWGVKFCKWQWVKRESATKTKAQETTFNITQSGELLSQKLESLFIDFAEEENLTLTDVTQRTEKAFDIEKVTKDFFNKFQERHLKFAAVIQGIENPKDANWYASVVLKPFHWGYHFDQIIARGGFDIILGNPPWEIFKPQAKEFFAEYSDLVTKNKMDIKTFEKEQKQLLANPEIATAWLRYQSQYPHVSLYFRSAEQYLNQISVVNGKKQGTDINLYKLFVEQCVNLLSPNGECGLVIPSGIYTDLGTKQLREMLFSQTKITGLFCFENKKAIFEGVDSRFKFVVLTFENGNKTLSFSARFMRHDVGELNSFPDDDCIHISVDLIKRLSPDSISVMEFKSDLDIFIAKKMSRFPLLGEEIQDKWNLKLTREFDMTNDSHLFKTEPGKGRLPLYEGKMIHQFNHNWGKPKYWLNEKEARQALLKRGEIDNGQKLYYQCYRLGFRDIASSTNERTMISTMLHTNIFCNHKLPTAIIKSDNSLDYKSELFLLTIFNSFVADYSLRQRVTTNLTFFIVYQTPVPRLTEKDPYFQEIVERAAKLICTTAEYDELAKEVGLTSHENGVTDERERGKSAPN